MIIMCGTMQQHFTHEVPRVSGAKGWINGSTNQHYISTIHLVFVFDISKKNLKKNKWWWCNRRVFLGWSGECSWPFSHLRAVPQNQRPPALKMCTKLLAPLAKNVPIRLIRGSRPCSSARSLPSPLTSIHTIYSCLIAVVTLRFDWFSQPSRKTERNTLKHAWRIVHHHHHAWATNTNKHSFTKSTLTNQTGSLLRAHTSCSKDQRQRFITHNRRH